MKGRGGHSVVGSSPLASALRGGFDEGGWSGGRGAGGEVSQGRGAGPDLSVRGPAGRPLPVLQIRPYTPPHLFTSQENVDLACNLAIGQALECK